MLLNGPSVHADSPQGRQMGSEEVAVQLNNSCSLVIPLVAILPLMVSLLLYSVSPSHAVLLPHLHRWKIPISECV